MKIIADKNIPYLKGVAEQLGETNYLAGADFAPETIKKADTLIIRTVTHFGKELLENSNVRLICSATIGYDHIDTKYCDQHNIKWTNAPGCNSGSVQQYITSVLITLAQQKSLDLNKMTIGIVGVGNVGSKVAQVCKLLGMNVLKNDPPRQISEKSNDFVDLEAIKKNADIITFHTPLHKDGEFKTHHLADEAFFSDLGKRPFIINSARGAIIKTEAIKAAIRAKKIRGAVIDCWENEPMIDQEYLNMVNVGTPHIAGYSADGKANATRMSLVSVAKFWNLDETIANQVKPLPIPNPVIDLNAFGTHKIERLYGALLITYNPLNDWKALIADPEVFKNLRNNYPLRRENIAYKVVNTVFEERELYATLGFSVE